MRTIVHLSDLHFDRVDRSVVEALARFVPAIGPDVIAISGDLTQRARRHQFEQARAFLDGLPRPQLVVPGNHDVPLYNVIDRFRDPLGAYRRYITDDLRPRHADDELLVLGANTTRSLTRAGGRLRQQDLRWMRDTLTGVGEHVIKVVVCHHPFDTEHHPSLSRRRDGERAVEALAEAGVDVFLTGHLHVSYAGHSAARYKIAGRSAIVVEAGTATSTRVRGETNAFNVLRVEPTTIAVERVEWNRAAAAFSVGDVQRFERTAEGWRDIQSTPWS